MNMDDFDSLRSRSRVQSNQVKCKVIMLGANNFFFFNINL